ncbi:MAG: AmmeMemoRadiSam system protein B, partial [Candidatus Omnitrophica bacterium]|nr:AmmeMemoRadiSam system protein B [Candidatus Omnitrophota bacterium]
MKAGFLCCAVVWGVLLMARIGYGENNIKHPNVSGQFYPSDPKELSALLDGFFARADVALAQLPVGAVIVPHAGYVYSGPVAAYAFKRVSAQKIATVVILAPSHFANFDGISVGDYAGMETPLGVVSVDKTIVDRVIAADPKFAFYAPAYEREHSLEVEIPFIQKTFPSAKIVPVIFGQAAPETIQKFSAALKDALGDRADTLIVASSDLSHYHDDKTARKMDAAVLELARKLDVEKLWEANVSGRLEMCGFIPVAAVLVYSRLQNWGNAELIRYGNSGDATGDRDRVVGYGAVAIYRGLAVPADSSVDNAAPPLTLAQKKRLLEIARQSMEQYVRKGKVMDVQENDPRLAMTEGAFVTLKRRGQLRGCIGNIIGQGPLYLTVRNMAIAAATQDPRFPPVKSEE